MAPERAARELIKALRGPPRPRTVADAAAESGLALRDAERGLHWLTAEYGGHLRATDEGELLFVFPRGFVRPRPAAALGRAAAWLARALATAARFVVRAWLAVVIAAYAAAFVGVLVALVFARSSDDGRDGGSIAADVVHGLLRALADAIFWTFHPLSPFHVADVEPPWRGRRGRRERRERREKPFYEKVNRFFFGPPAPAPDPLEATRRVLAEVRAQRGRVGPADVMRATGLPRAEADALMARLMLDYDGDVVVSARGALTYRFPDLRRTAAAPGSPEPRPEPAWARLGAPAPPLTGNAPGDDALIAGLNVFNAAMAAWAMSAGLTLENVRRLVGGASLAALPRGPLPVALGVVPLALSAGLLALPLGRAALRAWRARAAARADARLAVLREVLAGSSAAEPVAEGALVEAWRRAAGAPPGPGELVRVVASYGGRVDVDAAPGGGVRYRFVDLEAEAAALEAERAAASEAERHAGEVVFASDEPG
jgi:hypothetical protein